MKIASGCTARSYDLQKGYPLKCAGRLDKIFWRGIIDLQDRLRRRVFLGRRPTGRPAKAVRPRTLNQGQTRKADPGEDPGEDPGTREVEDWDQGSGAGTMGKTQEPGEDLDQGSGAGTMGKTWTPTDPREGGWTYQPPRMRTYLNNGVSRNHANFKKTSRVGVPGHRLRIHRRCQRISAFEAQFWV